MYPGCSINQTIMNEHAKFKITDKASTVIADDYRLLQVMSRFGIPLGFGDKTINEVCLQSEVDPFTFISVINFIKYQGEYVDIDIKKLDLRSLLNYLRRSHQYFLDYQFPNMRRNMLHAIDCSVKNEVPFLVLKFYDEYVEEVSRHMVSEEEDNFKYVDSLINGGEVLDKFKSEAGSQLSHHHQDIEDKLMDLKRLFILYYPQTTIDHDINAVVFEIYRTQEDLLLHCKVEDNLFLPALKFHEQAIKKKRARKNNDTADEKTNIDNELSERERDVVVCVAKGLSNKEIADKLCLSVNTVTTHRRNIAKKLAIHTSAGITIYAIVNKLVTLEDVNV